MAFSLDYHVRMNSNEKALKKLIREAAAMQRGERNLPKMNLLLDAFPIANAFDRKFVEALRVAVAWRITAKRERRSYPTL